LETNTTTVIGLLKRKIIQVEIYIGVQINTKRLTQRSMNRNNKETCKYMKHYFNRLIKIPFQDFEKDFTSIFKVSTYSDFDDNLGVN